VGRMAQQTPWSGRDASSHTAMTRPALDRWSAPRDDLQTMRVVNTHRVGCGDDLLVERELAPGAESARGIPQSR